MSIPISFESKKADANDRIDHARLARIFNHSFPGYTHHHKSTLGDDCAGTDWWVFRGGAHRPISVDLKIRTIDPLFLFGQDDLAIEFTSVKEAGLVGWALDETKQTDWILWLFPPTKRNPEGRHILVPFPTLLAVCKRSITAWRTRYSTGTQTTMKDGNTYTSFHIFVPRSEIFHGIGKTFEGAYAD